MELPLLAETLDKDKDKDIRVLVDEQNWLVELRVP
jgi:hypothetical protein